MKYIPSAVYFAADGYLSAHGLDGWGWFLFVGAILL